MSLGGEDQVKGGRQERSPDPENVADRDAGPSGDGRDSVQAGAEQSPDLDDLGASQKFGFVFHGIRVVKVKGIGAYLPRRRVGISCRATNQPIRSAATEKQLWDSERGVAGALFRP